MSRVSVPATIAFAAPAVAFMPTHRTQESLETSDGCSGSGLLARLRCLMSNSHASTKQICITQDSDLSLLAAALESKKDALAFDDAEVKMFTTAHQTLIASYASQGEDAVTSGSDFQQTHNSRNDLSITPVVCAGSPLSYGVDSSTQELAEELRVMMNLIDKRLKDAISATVNDVVTANEAAIAADDKAGDGLTAFERTEVRSLSKSVNEFSELNDDGGLTDIDGKQTVIRQMAHLNLLTSLFKQQHMVEDGEYLHFADFQFDAQHTIAYPRYKFPSETGWQSCILKNLTDDGVSSFELSGVSSAATTHTAGAVIEGTDGFLFQQYGRDPVAIQLAHSEDLDWAAAPLSAVMELHAISRGVGEADNGVRFLVNEYINDDTDDVADDFITHMKVAVKVLMENSDRLTQLAAEGLNDVDAGSWNKVIDDNVNGLEDRSAKDVADYAHMIRLLHESTMAQHDANTQHKHKITTMNDLVEACPDERAMCTVGAQTDVVYRDDSDGFWSDDSITYPVELINSTLAINYWTDGCSKDNSVANADDCGSCSDSPDNLVSLNNCDTSSGNTWTSLFNGYCPVVTTAGMSSALLEYECIVELDLETSYTEETSIITELDKATGTATDWIILLKEHISDEYLDTRNTLQTASLRDYADSTHKMEFLAYLAEFLNFANEQLGNLGKSDVSQLLLTIHQEAKRAKEDADTYLNWALQTPHFNYEALLEKNNATAGYYWNTVVHSAVPCAAGTYSDDNLATVCTPCPSGDLSSASADVQAACTATTTPPQS
jgi:hypothetical protein